MRTKFDIRIVVVAVCLLFSIVQLGYRYNVICAKQLVQAIKNEDYDKVEQITRWNRICINTYPTIMPKWVEDYIFDDGFYYPLNQAIGIDNQEIIELLIARGANVNCNDGATPLSLTYQIKGENWYANSTMLIENGADIDYLTSYSGDSLSILYDIVSYSYPNNGDEQEVFSAFQYAIEHIDIDKVDFRWVLIHAVMADRIKIVEYLLDNNYCDVNDTTNSFTPLMAAAREAPLEMVEYLLSKGADKTITDENGKTAYDYAVEFQRSNDILSLLRE